MGSLNGVVIAKGNVAPFIATLGTMTLLRGVALVLSNGSPISDFSERFLRDAGRRLRGSARFRCRWC